jgi:hypothetical protein
MSQPTITVFPPFKGVRFALGRIFATAGAAEQIPDAEVYRALSRHVSGDWGDLCPEDIEGNEHALKQGLRLLSAYMSVNGTRFWIITEADRSVTTVLLPDEY